MDRIKLLSIFMLASALIPAPVSLAGTVLAPRPSESQSQDQRYPESRFGAQPARVDLGVGPSYVRHAVSELDPVRDEIGDAPSDRVIRRSPAGLESSNQARAMPGSVDSTAPGTRYQARPDGTPEAPVRPETGMQDPTPSTVNRSGVQEVAVIASDLGYFPRTIFVTRDLPVRLFVTGASKNTLCIMMDSFQVRKQVRSQKIEEITFTPNVPGKYRFYCPVNGMEGTLIVKEYTTGIDTAWASSTNQ